MRIPALDGIRGIAATSVIALHAGGIAGGRTGVEVFFALSGFLIGGILLDMRVEPGWAGRFYARRFARTWPLYFAIVAVIFATSHDTLPAFWRFLTFTVNFEPAPIPRTAVLVLWSICVEEHAYLILPWLIVGRSARESGRALLAIVVISIATRHAAVQQLDQWVGYSYTPFRLDGIALGALGAWVHRYRRDWIPYAGPIALFLLGLKAGTSGDPWGLTSWGAALFWQPLGAMATAALVLAIVNGGLPIVARGLSHPALRWLGTISYGLYLWHPLVAEQIPLEKGYLAFAVVTAVTALVAWVSWTFFEKPMLAFIGTARPALPNGGLPTTSPQS